MRARNGSASSRGSQRNNPSTTGPISARVMGLRCGVSYAEHFYESGKITGQCCK